MLLSQNYAYYHNPVHAYQKIYQTLSIPKATKELHQTQPTGSILIKYKRLDQASLVK